MSKQTLFDKVWDAHVVRQIEDGPDVFFIDRHFIHEVTSPVAFNGLESRGAEVLFPERTFATADHNTPTINQHLPVADPLSANQLQALADNTSKYGISFWGLGHAKNGIVHIIGPENGITQPGMTIVCGDSHTSTHGAFGAIAFGIGTSEVEMVLATQCIMQPKPKKMRITIIGKLGKGVLPKDAVLYVISQISASGATGYFVEYAGEVFEDMSMEGRMTVCNMSIEMGARGGIIAPDEKTFNYLEGRDFSPKARPGMKQSPTGGPSKPTPTPNSTWNILSTPPTSNPKSPTAPTPAWARGFRGPSRPPSKPKAAQLPMPSRWNTWDLARKKICSANPSTSCSWVVAPMDASRISGRSPPS